MSSNLAWLSASANGRVIGTMAINDDIRATALRARGKPASGSRGWLTAKRSGFASRHGNQPRRDGVLMGMEAGQEFEDFVRKRSAALLRTAYALTGDHGHAEDLLQTALLRTARCWSAARNAPEAYARQVLVNLCRDRVRWLRRRPRESVLAEAAEPSGPAENVDAMAEQVGQRHSLIQALTGLPTAQRHVVVLRFLEDLSVSETAELLGISPGTVKSYTARALSSLRVILNDTALPDGRGTPEVHHAH
jgi:RNA polymerase sigma-70 factor (sigma-E family)